MHNSTLRCLNNPRGGERASRQGTADHRCMRGLVVELHDEAALPCLDSASDGETRTDWAAALGADGVHLRHASCYPCCPLQGINFM